MSGSNATLACVALDSSIPLVLKPDSRLKTDLATRPTGYSAPLFAIPSCGGDPPWSPISEGGHVGPPLQAKIFVWFAVFVIKNNFRERFSLDCERLRSLSLIQLIDIPTVVELFDETEIDKVFGLRCLCFRVAR